MVARPTLWIRQDGGSDRFRLVYINWGGRPDETGLTKAQAMNLASALQKSTGCRIIEAPDNPDPTIQ